MEPPAAARWVPTHGAVGDPVGTGALALPIALAFEDDLVRIVGEAVDGTLRQDRIVKERDPLIDGAIRGEDGGRAPVPFEDDFVEVVRLGGVEAPQTEVVKMMRISGARSRRKTLSVE